MLNPLARTERITVSEIERAGTAMRHFQGAVVLMDAHYRITSWNAAAEALYGVPATTAEGRSLAEVVPLVAYADGITSDQDVADALNTEGIWQGTVRQRHQAGYEVLVDAMLEVRRAADGSIRVVVLIGNAVDARPSNDDGEARRLRALMGEQIAQRSTALAATEARFRTLAEAAPQSIWLADVTGQVIYMNHVWYELTGLPIEQSMGDRWLQALHPADRVGMLEAWARAMPDTPFELEVRLRTPTGAYRIVGYLAVPVRDQHGAVLNWIGINTDLTERKQAEAALIVANREWEAFAYAVSHDLRVPLRHITGFIDLLLNHVHNQLDPTSAHYLDVIAESSAKMGQLIDALLRFARTTRAELRTQPVNLDPLVRAVIGELTPPERVVRWELGTLPTVNADPQLLQLVLVNLLNNALKYTAPRPEAMIGIDVSPNDDGEWVIRVRDNGVGFDQTYAHKLFNVFQRLHHEDEFNGTGIGLATVRRIIERHGGRVGAEGVRDGGATFFFTLPPAQRAAEHALAE